MEITAKIDDRMLQKSLRRLAVVQRKDLPVIVRQSARRVCVNMSRATAPFGFEESARQKVIKRINSDVSRVFRPIAQVSKGLEPEDRKRLAFVVSNRSPSVVTKLLKELGVNMAYRTTAPKRIHKAKRNTRTGRVARSEKPDFAVPSEARKKLLDQLIKRVGLAKHGWALCAKALGGSRGIPAWVARSKGKSQAGTVMEQRTAMGVFYVMANNVPYVSRLLSATGIRRSMQREVNFLRQEWQRRIKSNW